MLAPCPPPAPPGSILIGVDSESALIATGDLTPQLVCVSTAIRREGGELVTDLMTAEDGAVFYRRILSDKRYKLVIVNAPFDLSVACNEDPTLVPLVFDAFIEGRVVCPITLQKLIDVALGQRKFRRPTDGYCLHGVVKSNYYLGDLVALYYGEHVEKKDTWRMSYGLLRGFPVSSYPPSAADYARRDAVWHLRVYEAQVKFIEAKWGVLPDQDPQQRAAWALALMGEWGIRADAEATERFLSHCEVEMNKMRRVLHAHDAADCVIAGCDHGESGILKADNSRTMAEIRRRVRADFVARGVPVPRTNPSPKFPDGQVKTDEETLHKTNDPKLHLLADSMTYEKHRGQWGPVLRAATKRPVCCRYNVLVDNGRTSCSGGEGQEGTNIQNPPRKGDVRPCIVSRPKWVLCSTDADTIELRALAQNCLEMVGYSRMAEAIQEQFYHGGPELHVVLGAGVAGITKAEAHRLHNEDDVVFANVRQLSKHCFHPDTEILTKSGWKRIADLVPGEDVMAAIPSGPGKVQMVWQTPFALTSRDADELVWLKNKGVDLRVTPDHRMLGFNAKGEVRVVIPEEFNNVYTWANAGMFDGGEVDLDERLLRLAVATQADGHYTIGRQITFGFSKERKIQRLRSLLRTGEYEETYDPDRRPSPVTSFAIVDWSFADSIKALLDKKMFPWWWLSLTRRCREIVLDEVQYWDGSRADNWKMYTFGTTLRQNANVLQALAAITDRKSRCTTEDYTRAAYENDGVNREEWAPLHSLSVKDHAYSRGRNVATERIKYGGKVVCLSVPSSFVLVRDRGVTIVTGQCNFAFAGGAGEVTFVAMAHGFGVRLGETPEDELFKARMLRGAWFMTWEEMKAYFKVVGDQIARGRKRVRGVQLRGTIHQLVSGRIRGDCNFPAALNSYFSGRVADAFKEILFRLANEAYTGRCTTTHQHGGTAHCTYTGRTVLEGSRTSMFLHDEPFMEHPEDGSESDRAERQQGVVVEVLNRWMPAVPCTSTAVLMRRWAKGGKQMRVDGKIVPVKPVKVVVDGKERIKWLQDTGFSDAPAAPDNYDVNPAILLTEKVEMGRFANLDVDLSDAEAAVA